MQDSRRYRHFEIRPSERVVLVDGKPVDIKSRAFDVLLALEERRDRVVSKSELLDICWPGMVVEENNLAVHVSALRKALGPKVIATIPGRGYRFTATPDDGAAREPAPQTAIRVMLDKGLPPTGQFVGRERDLAELEKFWPGSRCITIVGAGGIGKTTLALAAAHRRGAELADGATWVALAEIADAALLPGAVAQGLGLDVADTVDPLPSLVNALAPQQRLLVIDNAEHLLEPVARLVRAVVDGAPRVQVLVTSQAPLKLDGEQLFRLGPLAVPSEDAVTAGHALTHGAVALFAAQARAADRSFEVTDVNVADVVDLCRRLDGVPLALKLAAARLPAFRLHGVMQQLRDRLQRLRQRDAPARQQTLLAALEWSHGLLGDVPKVVLRRLGVFSGGFPFDIVASVVGDDTIDEVAAIDALEELVDRSLVDVGEGDPPRYRLLETTREYARLRLADAGETAATQARHAQAVAAWMSGAYDDYWSLADGPWLARHAPELDNVRAALDWATDAAPALGIDLIGSTGVLFMLLGHAPEARRRFAALDVAARSEPVGAASARYWLERSRLQWGIANDRMLEYATLAVAQYRAIGDADGLALALRCAIGSGSLPEAEAAAALSEMTALVPRDAPARRQAQRLLAEANVLAWTGRMPDACAVWQALVTLTTNAGLDGMASAALAGLATALLASGNAEEALACARRLIADPRARHGNFVLHPLGTMAEAHLLQGHPGPARQAVEAFVAESRRRDWEWLGVYAGVFALLAAVEGRVDDAACLLGYADRAGPHVRDRADATTARSRAQAVVEKAMDAATFARRRAEGERLDEASVCALALAGPASR